MNKLPASLQSKARADLHALFEAASRAEAAFDRFLTKDHAKDDKAARFRDGAPVQDAEKNAAP